MNKKLAALGVIVVLAGILLSDSFYTVNEAEQALVIQFGEPRAVVQEPGLQVKMPFIQQVTFYEKRVLPVDPPVEQVILADQRRLDVDSFVRYRIVDPLRFFQSVNNEIGAQERIATITNASLRRVLGNATQLEVLSEERANLMIQIQRAVENGTSQFGVEIVDVRIGRADVPEGTVQSVYDRMRSEREREAAEFRAQGFEQAQQIRARADRERTVIQAEADREGQILRGEGDAAAIDILAQAYGQDSQFFTFYRTLQAYRNSLASDSTSMVLSPTGEFFQYFQNLSGSGDIADSLSRMMSGGAAPESDSRALATPEADPDTVERAREAIESLTDQSRPEDSPANELQLRSGEAPADGTGDGTETVPAPADGGAGDESAAPEAGADGEPAE
ncbi:MAG: protease modulator HflC [Azospirillaceae bacterium]